MKKITLFWVFFYLFFVSIHLQAKESPSKKQFENFIPVYTVTINNKPYKFVLETTLSETIIDKKLAEQLAATIKPQDLPPRLNDDPVKKASAFIKAPAMKIGDNNIYLDVLMIQDLSPHYKTTGFHIDGVLGMNAVNQLIWEFDNANQKNDTHPFSDRQIENKYPFCMNYNSSYTAPTLYVKKNNEIIPFILSFGTDISVIAREYINALNLQKGDDQGSDTLPEHENYYYLDDFTFADQQVKQDRFFSGEYNIFGTIFLNRFDKILLNPITQTFCFNHFNTESAAKIYRRLNILANNGQIELTGNAESLLNKLGLKNGDIIVSVNNVKYPAEQIVLVRNAVTYSKTLDLQIKRQGKISRIRIN